MDNLQPEEIEEEQPPGKLTINFPDLYRQPSSSNVIENNAFDFNLPTFHIRVESNINVCKSIWDTFSPKANLFDLWEFRYPFWLGYQHKPHFICLETDKIEAVLPLWFDEKSFTYSWFGSYWHEDNTFFATDNRLIPLLLKLLPQHTTLNAIHPKAIQDMSSQQFIADDPKYTLNIEHWNTIDPLLLKLSKKHRYNLKRDYKIISSFSPQININNFQDFTYLRQLNLNRFEILGDKHLAWDDPRRVKTFEKIIQIGRSNQSYNIRMLTVVINGIIAGVDLIAIYNNCYYPMVCGYNVEAFSGIGNYFTWIEIEDAIKLGASKIDVLEGNFGWKNRFFQSQPLYKLCT